jgi:hypothetical protein
MALDRPGRKLPLRDLMTDAEKRARQLGEHLSRTWLLRAEDLQDLSRPVRRKSPFPTPQALLNSLQKLLDVSKETDQFLEALTQELEEIRDHARRERLNRS